MVCATWNALKQHSGRNSYIVIICMEYLHGIGSPDHSMYETSYLYRFSRSALQINATLPSAPWPTNNSVVLIPQMFNFDHKATRWFSLYIPAPKQRDVQRFL